jgi:choline dehydrogenase-like flavoprotein
MESNLTPHMAKVSVREYDYVIIGDGTADLVLASRPLDDSAIHVTVLEAGEKYLDVNIANYKIGVA